MGDRPSPTYTLPSECCPVWLIIHLGSMSIIEILLWPLSNPESTPLFFNRDVLQLFIGWEILVTWRESQVSSTVIIVTTGARACEWLGKREHDFLLLLTCVIYLSYPYYTTCTCITSANGCFHLQILSRRFTPLCHFAACIVRDSSLWVTYPLH